MGEWVLSVVRQQRILRWCSDVRQRNCQGQWRHRLSKRQCDSDARGLGVNVTRILLIVTLFVCGLGAAAVVLQTQGSDQGTVDSASYPATLPEGRYVVRSDTLADDRPGDVGDESRVTEVIVINDGRFYEETVDDESGIVEHTYFDGRSLHYWSTGNIVDPANYGLTFEELEKLSDEEFLALAEETGYGTAPQEHPGPTGGVLPGYLVPIGALRADLEVEGDELIWQGPDRSVTRQYNTEGVPTGVTLEDVSSGVVGLVQIAYDPGSVEPPVSEGHIDEIRCISLGEAAADLHRRYPVAGCDG